MGSPAFKAVKARKVHKILLDAGWQVRLPPGGGSHELWFAPDGQITLLSPQNGLVCATQIKVLREMLGYDPWRAL